MHQCPRVSASRIAPALPVAGRAESRRADAVLVQEDERNSRHILRRRVRATLARRLRRAHAGHVARFYKSRVLEEADYVTGQASFDAET